MKPNQNQDEGEHKAALVKFMGISLLHVEAKGSGVPLTWAEKTAAQKAGEWGAAVLGFAVAAWFLWWLV